MFRTEDIDVLSRSLDLIRSDRKTLRAPNRIAYQPMEGNDAAADGAPGELTLKRYRDRAEGHAGIDFVEALAISRDGKARGDQLILGEATRSGIETLVREYRRINPSTPLLLQLTHSGRFSEEPVTPYPLSDQKARLLTDGDMARIQRDYVRATELAYECGADGIDFKHCHGYLCGAMLGPANRRRADWRWGGESIEERARFCLQTLALMMEAVPADRFLYSLRISAFEGIPGGFGSVGPDSVEEDREARDLKRFCAMLERAGVKLLNQSSGVPDRTPLLVRQTNENPSGFLDHVRHAEVMKRAARLPVIGSGYSYLKSGRNKLPGEREEKSFVAVGARNIRDERVDFVGIGRQSLSEPRFADKLLGGHASEIHWDTSCNQCAVSLRSHIAAGCVTYDPYYTGLFKPVKQGRRKIAEPRFQTPDPRSESAEDQ